MSEIVARHHLTLEEVDGLEDQLYAFNMAATGHVDGEGFGFVVEDGQGGVAGGIAGYSWGGIAEIRQLVLPEALRSRGLGEGLLRAAIDEMRRRGVSHIWVTTYDFQAPGLYERCGFERMAELGPWPLGHRHIVLGLAL